jgi:hypothetical protein
MGANTPKAVWIPVLADTVPSVTPDLMGLLLGQVIVASIYDLSHDTKVYCVCSSIVTRVNNAIVKRDQVPLCLISQVPPQVPRNHLLNFLLILLAQI